MSKWQLPNQKGTELWPSATRSPVKVIVEGAELSRNQAAVLKRQLEGVVNQFYMAAAQNYALGVATNQKTRKALPGVRMQYENVQGQEIVRVSVSKQFARQLEEKKTEKSPWECAIVELVWQDAPIRSPNLAAFMVSPELAPLAEAPLDGTTSYPGVAVNGRAWDSGGAFGEEPAIAFPNYPVTFFKNGATENRASLRVDLRPFAKHAVVRVEIWGQVPEYTRYVEDRSIVTESFLWAFEGRAAGADFAYLGPKSPLRIYRNPGFPYLAEIFPELAVYANNWYSYTPGSVSGPGSQPQPPSYLFDGTQSYSLNVDSMTWPASSPNVPRNPTEMLAKWAPVAPVELTYWDAENLWLKKRVANTVRFLDPALTPYDNIAPPEPPANGLWDFGGTNFTDYYVPIFGGSFVTSYPSLSARVEIGMSKAEVADAWSQSETVGGWYSTLWEFRSKFPDRLPMEERGTTVIPSYEIVGDASIRNHLGYTLLGTVTIDVQLGSASFSAA